VKVEQIGENRGVDKWDQIRFRGQEKGGLLYLLIIFFRTREKDGIGGKSRE